MPNILLRGVLFDPACIYRLFSVESLPIPISNQQWRDFLSASNLNAGKLVCKA